MRESNRELLGDNVVSQIDEAYGLDEEGELDGSYLLAVRPPQGTYAPQNREGLIH